MASAEPSQEPVTTTSVEPAASPSNLTTSETAIPPPPSTMSGAPTTIATPPPPMTSHGDPFHDEHAVQPPRALQAESAPALPPRPEENPKVQALKSMFPDFDAAILLDVLESVQHDQDRAIDVLLGMSDPDYVAHEAPAPPRSQTELDEEFARRLMLEDQQQQQVAYSQQQQWAPAQPAQGARWDRRDAEYDDGAWERPHRGDGQQQQQGGDFAEIQEQFSKIAETGKKTFNSLFNKVKSKIQEFDQPRAGGPSQAQGVAPTWGAPSTSPPPPQQQQQQQQQPAQQQQPVPQASYFPPMGSPPRASALSAGTSPMPVSSPSSVDPNKIGMLPKRPVSLLAPAQKPDDDDDDLYASPSEPQPPKKEGGTGYM